MLSDEPHLLSAEFEINGHPYPVMIDTGATISCIPEFGSIIKNSRTKLEKANVEVNLANNAIKKLNKKFQAILRPAGSTKKPRVVQLYVQNNVRDIFGYQALIGLNHLKLFELDINIKNGVIHIYHDNMLIGQESPDLKSSIAGLRLVTKQLERTNDPKIDKILNRFDSVFADIDEKPIRGKPMRFYTVHQRPIFAKQRHYNEQEVLEMKTHIHTLLDKGIIEPTNSGYAATSRIIPKKNGTGRLVVNYIPLNAATYRDSYSLPHITDILGILQGKEYFTTMDCAQGFYQIQVDPHDRHKTAFSTPIGNFQFIRCPFGARNSCAMFQSEMNRIFSDGLYTKCVIYVDDILVFGKTREEHDKNLEWVLSRCEEYHVKIKLEKCYFAKKEVKYLGFLISGDCIRPIPERVDTLQKAKAPRDKTELRSLIGKLNFYSRFIPNYSRSLEPLRALLLKNKDYQWKPFHQEAFERLTKELCRVQSQTIVPRNHHKILSLHILQDSFEAILSTAENKLVSRASRLLSTTESNYSFPEKQLLALMFAVNKFKLFIEPENFTVKAPNKDLLKIFSLTNRPERVENLLLKMPPGFDSFNIEVDSSLPISSTKNQRNTIPEEIFYVDGACKANGKPNCRASWAVCAENDASIELTGFVEENPSNQSAELAAAIEACKLAKSKGLSEISIVTDSKYLFNAATNWIDRWRANDWRDNKNKPVVHTKLFKDLLYAKEGLDIEWIHVKGHSDNIGNIRADTLARSRLDTKSAILYAITTNGSRLQQDDDEVIELKERIQRDEVRDFEVIDNIVYYIDRKLPENSQARLYVPKVSRHWLLTLAHDDVMYGGHLGIKKTYRKLTRFWWPKMHTEVESYVKSCGTCQRFKQPRGLPPGYLHNIPVSESFEHVHLDMIGPVKTSYNGNAYVITATDAFSKWAFAKACLNIRTSVIINFVEEQILSIHGKPKCFITDRGSQFESNEWKEFIKKLGVEHRMTSPYHPQSNGIDERLNGTLVHILRTYVDKYQEDWDEHLKWSLYVYNTTVHESTGYSPYQVLHGMEPRSPLRPKRPRRTTLPASDVNPDQTANSMSSESPNASKGNSDNPDLLHTDPPIQDLASIRSDVATRNRIAQEAQKKYYDKRHRPHNLYLGQLVYFRVQSIPTYLCKKFHVKWDGPCIIIGFVGSKENPKAVKLFDYDRLEKKTVAIQDVKPVIDTYGRPFDQAEDVNTSRGHDVSSHGVDQPDPLYYMDHSGSSLDQSTSRMLRDITVLDRPITGPEDTQRTTKPPTTPVGRPTENVPGFSKDSSITPDRTDKSKPSGGDTSTDSSGLRISRENQDPMQILVDPIENIPTISILENNNLDLTARPTGPLSSTPKRVIISDRVKEYVYPNESVPSMRRRTLRPPARASATLESLYYIDPRYHIDDPRKDPTYRPPKTMRDKSKQPETNEGNRPEQRLSKQSLIPRYNLKSQPTTSSQRTETQPKSILKYVSGDNSPTDLNNNTTDQQSSLIQIDENANIENPMKNIQTKRNTQQIDINEDDFISFSDTSSVARNEPCSQP